MSAYGDIQRLRPSGALPLTSTVWRTSSRDPAEIKDSGSCVIVHHLTLDRARLLTGLNEYLSSVFAKEVDNGMTYPQEGPVDQQAFENYFFSGDVFVATISGLAHPGVDDGSSTSVNIEVIRGEWDNLVAGFYYVRF